ncbi:hypothetical protein ACFFOP_02680 [Sinosporangium siamense]|uniref:hypothetical protein n=1 Tax=Sinosporangium siamense TaxID=1367973 RepID=UPI0035ED80DF
MRFVVRFGSLAGRPAELFRRWIWRGAAAAPRREFSAAALRHDMAAIHTDPLSSAQNLIRLLPRAPLSPWRPDLYQTRLGNVHGKLNFLGLLSRFPRRLSAEGHGEPLDAPNVRVVMESGGAVVPEQDLRSLAEGAGTVRFSLAGVQAKFSMCWEGKGLALPMSGQGGDWIVKPGWIPSGWSAWSRTP